MKCFSDPANELLGFQFSVLKTLNKAFFQIGFLVGQNVIQIHIMFFKHWHTLRKGSFSTVFYQTLFEVVIHYIIYSLKLVSTPLFKKAI